MDKFEIKYITTDYDHPSPSESISLKYTPYNISCKIWDNEENKNLFIMVRVNDSRDYCFNIHKKNCRFVEMSEFKCEDIKKRIGPN